MRNFSNSVLRQETYLGKNKRHNYFEGWYFKIVTSDQKRTIAFIPVISTGNDEHAFIQVVDNIKNKAYYFRYNIEEFSFSNDPFYIKIGSNVFSLTEMVLDIEDIGLKGKISFAELLPIKKSVYSPNIMGPFAYLPFMECNHCVISLGHHVTGKMKIYNKKVNFTKGLGYIEKDYGISFPKKYIWLQASDVNPQTNIFLSIATIPFKLLSFDGLIGILMIAGKEYRFATYKNAKLIELKQLAENNYFIKIKQGALTLEINLTSGDKITLVSPSNGRMNSHVQESLNSIISVKLINKKDVIFESTFNPCTTEIFL